MTDADGGASRERGESGGGSGGGLGGWLRRIVPGRGGESGLGSGAPITLDVEARQAQLLRLEKALDALAALMRENTARMSNPGWRERAAEYARISGEAYTLRRRGFTREELLDLVFEVRPAMTGDLPPDVEPVRPLQDELMSAADALRVLLPSERPGAAQG